MWANNRLEKDVSGRDPIWPCPNLSKSSCAVLVMAQLLVGMASDHRKGMEHQPEQPCSSLDAADLHQTLKQNCRPGIRWRKKVLGKKSSASCCRERASSHGTRYISAAKTRQKMLGPGRTPDASGVDAVSALVCTPCRSQRPLLRG